MGVALKRRLSGGTYFDKERKVLIQYESYRLGHCDHCANTKDSNRQRCTKIYRTGFKLIDGVQEKAFEEEVTVCMHNPCGKPTDTGIGTGYEFVDNYYEYIAGTTAPKTISFRPPADVQNISKERSKEEISFINEVYQYFMETCFKLQSVTLYKEDRKDLLKRFMTPKDVAALKKADLWEEDLKNIKQNNLNNQQKTLLSQRAEWEKILNFMGYFSVPSIEKTIAYSGYKCKLQTAISKELHKKFGDKLLAVPGFMKSKDKKGNEFITFKYYKIQGYFIPYHSIEGKILGFQYRLTEARYDAKGKLIRYLWYSSEQASSGSPIDFFCPIELLRDDVILVTEGATKGKVAASKMKIQGLFEAGVGNYKNLIKALDELEQRTGKQYKIILALDMDKYTNVDSEGHYPVLEAEMKTIELLKVRGNSVHIAEWDGKISKGIDDALSIGLKLNYKAV